MAKYAHQKTIIKEESDFKNHPYVKLNIEDIQEAMKKLSGYDFELYIYLYMNQDDFELDYSPSFLEKNYLGSRKTWQTARTHLVEQGYLVDEGSNHFVFVPRPGKLIEKSGEEIRQWDF